MMTTTEFETGLQQFNGTNQLWKHSLSRLNYTDGARWFAANGGEHGAYWLIDLIAFQVAPLLKKEDFLNIKVIVANNKATLTVDDGNDNIFKTIPIEYTDLQPGKWCFYLCNNVLMLRSEY